MNKETIGLRILTLRNKEDLTCDIFAEKLGVDKETVESWETGESMPDLASLEKMSELFGITINELIKDDAPSDDAEVVDDKVEIGDINEEDTDKKEKKDKKGKKNDKTVFAVRSFNFDPKDPKSVENRYQMLKTLKWSALVAPISAMIVVVGLALTMLIMAYPHQITNMANGNKLVALIVLIALCILVVLLAIDCILYKAGMKYRYFYTGVPNINYPKKGVAWFNQGVKKFFVWLGRYLFAVLLFHKENKRISKDIDELTVLMVTMGLKEPPKEKKAKTKKDKGDNTEAVKIVVGESTDADELKKDSAKPTDEQHPEDQGRRVEHVETKEEKKAAKETAKENAKAEKAEKKAAKKEKKSEPKEDAPEEKTEE